MHLRWPALVLLCIVLGAIEGCDSPSGVAPFRAKSTTSETATALNGNPSSPNTPAPDPRLSPEFELEPPAVVGGNAGPYLATAAGDSGYLVAWSGGPEFVRRVNPDGASSPDALPLILQAGGPSASRQAIAWDGANWLVVWQLWQVWAQRVSPSGELVDPAPVLISSNPQYPENPAVAFNGSEYMIAWPQSLTKAPGVATFVARFIPDGGLLDTPGIEVADGGDFPSIASDGADFLVSWRSGTAQGTFLYAARVGPSGAVLDDPPIALGAYNGVPPAMVWDGKNYVIAWNDSSGALVAQRVAADGGFVDPAPFSLGIAGVTPQATFDGTDTVVVAQMGTINAVRIDMNGSVAATGTIYGASDEGLSISSIGGSSFVAFEVGNIWGLGLGGAGSPLTITPASLLSTRINNQHQPAVSANTNEVLVTWIDDRDGTMTPNPYGLLRNLVPWSSDAGAFPLTDSDPSTLPRIATDGQDFVAAWQHQAPWIQGMVQPILSDGGLGSPIDLGGGDGFAYGDLPAIVYGNGIYSIFWGADFLSNNHWILGARRMRPDGGFLDTSAQLITPTDVSVGNVNAVFIGDHVLVLWNQGPQIFGEGYWLDGGFDCQSFALAHTNGNQSLGGVAWDGTRSLVVWSDDSTGIPQIMGAFADVDSGSGPNACPIVPDAGIDGGADAGGTDAGLTYASTAFLIAPADAGQLQPAITFDGTHYVVAWVDERAGFPQVYAARVTADGGVLDPGGLLISTSDAGIDSLALGTVGNARTLVVYSSLVQDWRSYHLMGRFFGEGACSATSDCASTAACLSGVCDSVYGVCGWNTAPDGTACNGGQCLYGTCELAGDAGSADSGTVADGGSTDAGSVADGGSMDSGTVADGGSMDSGTVADGGELDAGPSKPPDSGVPPSDGGVGTYQGTGCGCSTVTPVTSIALLILALGVPRRRRGRRLNL